MMHASELRIGKNLPIAHRYNMDKDYDEKKDFTCSCLYTCNVCLEADKLNVSRKEHYNKTVNEE